MGVKKSKYPNVYWHEKTKKWNAKRFHKGKAHSLGYFISEEEAYEKAVIFCEENNLPISTKHRATKSFVKYDETGKVIEVKCISCCHWLPVSDYYKSQNLSGTNSSCKTCSAKRDRYKKYGITNSDFLEKVSQQNALCAICKEQVATQVDHCHVTGKIRSLLCNRCNLVLGLCNEDTALFLELSKYARLCQDLKESNKENKIGTYA